MSAKSGPAESGRSGGALSPSAAMTSAASSIKVAPCLINALEPRARGSSGEPGTAAYKTGLRDAIMSTKELVGTHGVYNFKPDDRYGSDQRAVVIVRMEKGQWKLAP